MIAEAATCQRHRQHPERRRTAARQKTVETLWNDVAKRQRQSLSALQQPDVPASVRVAPPPPAPEPPVQAGSARQFVFPNVIAGEAPVVRKPWPTFADVLRTFDGPYRRRYGAELTVQQDKVLREMLACYTKMLGTHEWTCGDCDTVVELPNGCNNRHCCTCGSAKRRRWAEVTCSQILPIEYAHLVLTVPAQITRLAMINQKVMYSIVLREGAYTVLDGGRKLFGIELALLALLHTWGQLLNSHVHSHCLLPLGGLRWGALQWVNLSQKQFNELLDYVRREFSKRFCKALRKAFRNGELQFDGDAELEHLASPTLFEYWLEPLENMSWIVRCGDSWDRRKADFGPDATEKVVRYLANYVGRVALSDSRILDIQGDEVLFRFKDYRDNNQQKADWIDGVELIHRFLQHLLPSRFRHVRRYGWMGPRVKPEKRAFIRQYHGLDAAESPESSEQTDEQQQQEIPLEEQEHKQICRFCTGDMRLTGRTERPRVSELMQMPLACFRQAQVGHRITLGARLPEIEAKRRGDPSAPVMGRRAAEIRKQLIALATSGSL